MSNDVTSVYTASELASLAGVSTRAVEKQCSTKWLNEGKARKSGRTWLINKSTGDDYIRIQSQK